MQGWKHSKRGDPNSSVKLISLDCEMVVCEGDARELVRICAVGSDYQVSTYDIIIFSRELQLIILCPYGCYQKECLMYFVSLVSDDSGEVLVF